MNSLLEARVIERFVRKDKRDRYKMFVSSHKSRPKLLEVLPHFRHFDWSLFEEVDSFSDPLVQERLQALGKSAAKCYAMSENKSIDAREVTINEASLHVGGDQATILVFGDADCIYYEGEPPFRRYISRLT